MPVDGITESGNLAQTQIGTIEIRDPVGKEVIIVAHPFSCEGYLSGSVNEEGLLTNPGICGENVQIRATVSAGDIDFQIVKRSEMSQKDIADLICGPVDRVTQLIKEISHTHDNVRPLANDRCVLFSDQRMKTLICRITNHAAIKIGAKIPEDFRILSSNRYEADFQPLYLSEWVVYNKLL